MDILLPSERHAEKEGSNHRNIAFYTDKQARPGGKGRFREGLTLLPGGGGELRDTWGNPYRVRFDSNFDGKVEDPNTEASSTFVPDTVLVWSAGPDADFETWKDNVKSW